MKELVKMTHLLFLCIKIIAHSLVSGNIENY